MTAPDETDRTVTLSTGHEVTLPLSTRVTMAGAAFTAAADAVDPLLPDALRPVRLTPARTAVLLLGVEYHRIGAGFPTYDEFGIFLPAVPADGTTALRSLVRHDFGGYTWQLPVTTEPARALGELWGFPKTVADIGFVDEGNKRRATLAIDGTRVLSLSVRRPRSAPISLRTRSYTDGDGTVWEVPVCVDGDGGAVPGGKRVSLDLGTHSWADQLRVLGSERALGTVAFEGEFVVEPPEQFDGN